MLAATARHLILVGGKRLRPFIVLLASRFGDRRDPRVVPAAAVVELTHIGSLYHDDVMDEALIRRGVPSAHTIWGNSVAVLTGDFLFARAARLISGLGPEAIQVHAKAFSRLAEGQSAETVGPDAEADPLGHYLDVLGGKKASLFAASAEIGSLLAEAPPATTASLARACEAWGLAFQLADDVLDITSDSARSGKPVGTDLREGVPTLPALYVLKSSSPSDARLIDLLSSGQLTDPDVHSEALETAPEAPHRRHGAGRGAAVGESGEV